MIARLTGSTWVRGLLTAGVLVLLATRIDLHATAASLVRLSPAMAAAVLVLLGADRGIMIWRWFSLLRATGIRIPLKSAAWIYLVSSFAGTYTALAGDAARALTLTRRNQDGNAAVASVGVDRLLGLVALLVIGLAGAIGAGAAGGTAGLRTLAVLALLGGAVAPVLLFADRWLRVALPGGWHRAGLPGRLLRLADAFAQYRGHRGTLLFVFALSLGVQLLRIVQAYLLGRGIGIDVELSYYLLFMPPGLVALMLPISIGGFGAPQALIVWMLQPRGVPEAEAFALSTLIVLSGIVANLPGALLFVRRRSPAPAAHGS